MAPDPDRKQAATAYEQQSADLQVAVRQHAVNPSLPEGRSLKCRRRAAVRGMTPPPPGVGGPLVAEALQVPVCDRVVRNAGFSGVFFHLVCHWWSL